MTREQIKEQMKDILKSEKFMSMSNIVDGITEESSLINDLALDSIQILELIVVMEARFSFVCEPNELNIDLFDDYGALINFIEGKTSQLEITS
jgi:acyl carrier protein